jgi:hypothetical protein
MTPHLHPPPQWGRKEEGAFAYFVVKINCFD